MDKYAQPARHPRRYANQRATLSHLNKTKVLEQLEQLEQKCLSSAARVRKLDSTCAPRRPRSLKRWASGFYMSSPPYPLRGAKVGWIFMSFAPRPQGGAPHKLEPKWLRIGWLIRRR